MQGKEEQLLAVQIDRFEKLVDAMGEKTHLLKMIEMHKETIRNYEEAAKMRARIPGSRP